MTQDVRTIDEQTPTVPEVVEPPETETRKMKLEADDQTPEEAGYGYGV